MDLKSYFMNKYGRAGEGRLEEQREKVRGFEREEAGALAKAKMAEIEREQTGLTRRAGITEAGAMERERLQETGRAERGRLQFGTEGTAAQKLSAAKDKESREKIASDFTVKSEEIFGKYTIREGEAKYLPPEIQQIHDEARSIARIEGDYPRAIEYAQTKLAEREKTETERAKYAALPKEQLAIMEAEEVERAKLALVSPEERAAEEQSGLAKASAKKRSTVAQRLRKEYEEETRAPYIGEATSKRLGEAWRTRKPSPYVEVPRGLR